MINSSFHTSSKPLKEVDIRPPENTVKGAVKLDPDIGKYVDADFGFGEGTGVPWTYVTFDKQNEVLSDLITRLGVELKLPQADKNLYALKFESRENDGAFLTDENRALVRQGFMLILTASPERYSHAIVERLRRSPNRVGEPRATLSELTAICGDFAFASQFHRAGGITQLLEMVENGSYSDDVSAQSQLLQALLVLMEHSSLMQWTDVSNAFVSKIAENITGRAKQEDNTLLLSSLNIIDLVLNSKSEDQKQLVMREVPFESLIRHLEKSDERVIHNVLTLMNSLYSKASNEDKSIIVEHVHATPFRRAIENSVLRKCRQLDVGIEQQLLTVQRIQLNELARKAMHPPSEADIERLQQLKALNTESGRGGHSASAQEARRHEWANFAAAVAETPPGSLAVEMITAFATHHSDSIAKISMENSLRVDGNVWSVPLVCVRLVQLLIDILHIVNEPEDGDRLVVMLFKSDRPFIDLFAVMVRLFHRTWREMHASEEDINKVLAVVQKQMDICMSERPETMEKFEELLTTHSYPYMQKIWERERSAKEAEELQSDAVRELREFLRPSIIELIKKNRKNVLKNGYTFGKLSQSKSIQKGQQFWYWKLDPNEKTLLCTDCSASDSAVVIDPAVTIKIAISDIQRVSTGGDITDSMHTLTKSKKNAAVRGLTLEVGDKPEIYHLVTTDEAAINAWVDGINALIGSERLSAQAQHQVDRFLNIELKMRLLQLDHVPNVCEIPPLPSNLDWIPRSKAMV
ncbi:Cell death abnormality protein 12 [Toxocara canis]|uniref:Cell death abnormality protein 12 n=1 Tax=Toxocara canis TaxID=6265 RepID=A0A0B2USR0_TOXCA|nr:Cell death abnormality protein 12 [Toxocara canis]